MKEKILNCIEVFVVGYGIGIALGMGTRNVYPCILALVWYAINKSIKDNDNRNRIAILVLSVCYSLATTLFQACNAEITKSLAEYIFAHGIMFVSLTLIWNTILRIIWDRIGDGDILRSNSLKFEDKKKVSAIVFVIVFGILFIRLLLDYPGDVSNDSIGIIQQSLYDYEMHGGFPPVLAIIMRWCIGLAELCKGDMNLVVFLYCLIQVLLFSYVVVVIVDCIAECGINRFYCYITVVYFTVMPFNVHFSHTIWKDTPFALFTALFVLLTWKQTMKSIEIKSGRYWADLAGVIISGIGMAILRANGYYALLLCIPCGLILFWKKRKDLCLVYLIVLALSKLIMGPINDKIIHENNMIVYERVQQKAEQENTVGEESTEVYIPITDETNVSQSYGQSGIYIITSQQLAAVYMQLEDISSEEKQLLDTVFKLDQLEETYIPYISDHTMYSLKRMDRKQYLNAWITEGIKHPLTYIKAWVDMTCGYWYPEVMERGVYIEELKENDYGIKKAQVLPSVLYSIKEKADRLYTRIPFYGLIWSIGFVVWITAFCVTKMITRKGWMQALSYIPLIGVWATLLIATPVYGEFRYLYSVFFALPIIVVMPFVDTKEKGLS